jgi:flagellar operon protein
MNAMADKAEQKGAKQSLFMLDNVAMVVSIKNRTVITAVDGDSMRENVFTNIDSAAIIR